MLTNMKRITVITILVLVVLGLVFTFVGIDKVVVDKTIGLGVFRERRDSPDYPGSVSYLELPRPGKLRISVESEEPITFWLTDSRWCQGKTRESQDRPDKYYADRNNIIKETFTAIVDTNRPCMLIYGKEEGVKVRIKITENLNLFFFAKLYAKR